MTLTLTFTTTVDNDPVVSTYDREYPSLAEFLTDHATAYNDIYGEGYWTAVETAPNEPSQPTQPIK